MTGPKLATSHPAQAVGAPAGGVLDGDGGGTAGPSCAGRWAAHANGSHPCETPPWRSSPSVNVEPTMSRRTPPLRRAQTPGSADSSGHSSLELGGVAEPFPPVVTPPPFSLQPCRFRVGTWNMRSKSFQKNGKQNAKAPLIHSIMDVEKIDLLVVTETHSPDDLSFSVPNSAVLAQSGIDSSRAGVALVARDSFSWSCSDSTILIPGYALVARVSHHKSTKSFWILCLYGNI